MVRFLCHCFICVGISGNSSWVINTSLTETGSPYLYLYLQLNELYLWSYSLTASSFTASIAKHMLFIMSHQLSYQIALLCIN